jgi:dihydroorotate dehydrogenase (fumarate)
MSDLSTTFMGIPLKSPIVVAASSISSMIDRVQMAERVGAGALVIRSLFEEQIQVEQQRFDDYLAVGGESFPEALSYFPAIEHGQADEHLMWVEKTRKAVKMPLIASLNAVSRGSWVEYARQLESTGVDGLELNVYIMGTNPDRSGAELEQELLDIVQSVKSVVKIPVAVKLSPYYASTLNVAIGLDKLGVEALVLFNRFVRPTVDVESETLTNEMFWSSPEEMRLPLNRVARIFGHLKADMALNTGVHSGEDVVRAILVGATVVQVASALFVHGIPYISTMLRDIEAWMGEKGYDSLDDFRGKMSQKNCDDPFAFERAQYVNLLLSQH